MAARFEAGNGQLRMGPRQSLASLANTDTSRDQTRPKTALGTAKMSYRRFGLKVRAEEDDARPEGQMTARA